MKNTHEDNPISPRHPLLELLLRAGFVFDGYYDDQYSQRVRYVYGGEPEAPGAPPVNVTVFESGSWRVSDIHRVWSPSMTDVSTEGDLCVLLQGTYAEVILRLYKLAFLLA